MPQDLVELRSGSELVERQFGLDWLDWTEILEEQMECRLGFVRLSGTRSHRKLQRWIVRPERNTGGFL